MTDATKDASGTNETARAGRASNWSYERVDPDLVVIRDLGPWDQHLSVTNDAEGVIRQIRPAAHQRVFYYDSVGDCDEILHKAGADGVRVFAGFAPGKSVGRR